MASSKFKSMSDFEWASVARYVVYISCVAGLVEINWSHVNCFRIGSMGPLKLLTQKKLVLARLQANLSAIERFVGRNRADLTDDEISVLRSVYLGYKRDIVTVGEHVEFAAKCQAEAIMQSFELGGVTDDLF